MAELKTKQTEGSVQKFLKGIKGEQQRKDSIELARLMRSVTKSPPRMWGANIVGFGNRRLKYDSGRELDWFYAGFSPRKQALTLYLMIGLDRQKDLLRVLGKHKTGKSCLYIKKLDDVRTNVLRELIKRTVKFQKAK